MTKKIVSDSFFAIIEEKKQVSQSTGILVNRKTLEVKKYEKYLNRVLKSILKTIKNYNSVIINSIDGFNYKYVVDYNIGNIKKQLFMLIFVHEDGNLDFKITNIDNEMVNINGTICDDFNIVKVNWLETIKDIKGILVYNSNEAIIEEKISKENEIIISNQYTDTLLDEDTNIISFYMDLCGLNELKNIMKIDDYSYLLSDSKIINEEASGIFYNNISCQINILEDEVIIKYRQKNGLNKYNEQIKVVLEDDINEFILKKMSINNNSYILIENKRTKNGINNYSYEVLKVSKDNNLFTPFNIEKRYKINKELKTIDMAKQYIKKNKGGI